MIFVDEFVLRRGAPAPFRRGSSRLTTDGTEGELHEFAAKLGLRLEWFQPRTPAHYELTRLRRSQAVRLGAVYVSARRQATRRLEAALRSGRVPNGDRLTVRQLLGPIDLSLRDDRTSDLFVSARAERQAVGA